MPKIDSENQSIGTTGNNLMSKGNETLKTKDPRETACQTVSIKKWS